MKRDVGKHKADSGKDCFVITVGERDSRNYVCRLGEGVIVWANEIHVSDLDLSGQGAVPGDMAVINLCLTGRCEIGLPGGNYVYMMPGLLDISSYKPVDGYHYPGSLYEGIEIVMNTAVLTGNEPSWLSSFGLTCDYLNRILERGKVSAMAGVSETAMKLGTELYKALQRQDLQTEDYRFLTVQLLYLLKNGAAEPLKNMHYATKGQRRIATEVEQKITSDFRRRYTVEELAAGYGISPSALKKYFEIVFGMPISRYLRGKRMEEARRLLSETDLSVGEIAAACGYENQGKFGTAFKETVGTLPLEYRRQNYTQAG